MFPVIGVIHWRGLFLVDPSAAGVTRRGYPTQDGLRAAEVTLSSVRVPSENMLGDAGALAGDRACGERGDRGTLCRGGRHHAGNARNDAGIPEDASAVRPADRQLSGAAHRSVDMLVAHEQARSIAMFAAVMAGEEMPPNVGARCRGQGTDRPLGQAIGQDAIQLHGGIGMTMMPGRPLFQAHDHD